jgi:hypothetical protein
MLDKKDQDRFILREAQKDKNILLMMIFKLHNLERGPLEKEQHLFILPPLQVMMLSLISMYNY